MIGARAPFLQQLFEAPSPVKTLSARRRVRGRPQPTPPPEPPERGVKAATSQLLLDTAMTIIQEAGHIPSVAEVAVRSRVMSGAAKSVSNRNFAGAAICSPARRRRDSWSA